MCNINIVYKLDKKCSRRLPEFMNVASAVSFESNSDGEGFVSFNDDGMRIDKSNKKIIYNDSCWFLASHQRLTTSGKGVKNVHPYETENFIMMHNGVFTGMGNDKKSDSREYLDLIEASYKKHKCVKKAVKEVNKDVWGSYSILIYEKKKNKMYYFKEDNTSMYIVKNSKYIVMSTNSRNVRYAKKFFGIRSNVMEIKALKIYDVFQKMKRISSFKEGTYEYKEAEESSLKVPKQCHYEDFGYYGENDKWFSRNTIVGKETSKRFDALVELLGISDTKALVADLIDQMETYHWNRTYRVTNDRENLAIYQEAIRMIYDQEMYLHHEKLRKKFIKEENKSAMEELLADCR